MEAPVRLFNLLASRFQVQQTHSKKLSTFRDDFQMIPVGVFDI